MIIDNCENFDKALKNCIVSTIGRMVDDNDFKAIRIFLLAAVSVAKDTYLSYIPIKHVKALENLTAEQINADINKIFWPENDYLYVIEQKVTPIYSPLGYRNVSKKFLEKVLIEDLTSKTNDYIASIYFDG